MAAAILTILILQRSTRRLLEVNASEDQRISGENREKVKEKERERRIKEKEKQTKRRQKEREMKMTWKKKSGGQKRLAVPNLPFETPDDSNQESNFQIPNSNQDGQNETLDDHIHNPDDVALADEFLEQGNELAEDGKYREALGKWEAAITLMPERAVLHEQKAQVLLEVGDAWGALKAATRASELDPSWAEAWTTLGRAQLNFGEPDDAIESFDKALAIKAELPEARADRQTAMQLVKKRKQLHTAGVSIDRSRYVVGDGSESNLESESVNVL